MKSTLAIATIAIVCAAGHPFASTVNTPLAQRAPSVAFTLVAGESTADAWNASAFTVSSVIQTACSV